MVKRVLRILKWVGLGIACAAAVTFLVGLLVMALWNWLLPDLLGLPPINFLQAWGLLILGHLLLGGGPRAEYRRERRAHGNSFRKKVKERFDPEDQAAPDASRACP